MFDTDVIEEVRTASGRDEARSLLEGLGLRLDGAVDATFGLRRNGRLVATASCGGDVIKCLAVEPSCRGEGLAARVVTAVIDRMAERGIHHQFVYTTGTTAETLAELGFTEVACVGAEVVLLEGGMGSVLDWTKSLRERRHGGDRAACVVVNGNPLTLGHLHVLRTALEGEGALHVLVVSTDRSLFPADVRRAIVEAATADWPSTAVHDAGEYLVSMATFPSYFTRDEDVAWLQARLDVAVFCRHAVPALGITARYVGEEPYCPVTERYNRAMAEGLPAAGVAFHVIPRKADGGEPISASRVRRILHEGGDVDAVRHLVPDATYEFLCSPRGAEVVARIRASSSRH